MAAMIDINSVLPDSLIMDMLVRISTIPDPEQPSLFDLHLSSDIIQQSVVIAKSYHWYSIPYDYGPHYRVLLSVGGLQSSSNGVLVANALFLSLFINSDFELITYDVHGITY